MPDYPFKINVSTKNGTQNAWYDVDFADDTDTIVSASAIVTRINNMNRATTYSEDDTLSGVTSPNWGGGGGSVYLSASYTEPNTGSIVFTDTETSTNDGLDYYMFWGTKVCATLGLPEGIRIYTENFKLSDDSDDPDNYLSGDIIADGMAVKNPNSDNYVQYWNKIVTPKVKVNPHYTVSEVVDITNATLKVA